MYDLYNMYDMYDMYDLYNLAQVAGWEPYSLHDLPHVFWAGSVVHTDRTPPLTTAGEEL